MATLNKVLNISSMTRYTRTHIVFARGLYTAMVNGLNGYCLHSVVVYICSVQKQTIPVLVSGKDAVVRSQTGSGTTKCVLSSYFLIRLLILTGFFFLLLHGNAQAAVITTF